MTSNADLGTPDDGHTIDVGYVHVLTDDRSECVTNCPHPDHRLPPNDGKATP